VESIRVPSISNRIPENVPRGCGWLLPKDFLVLIIRAGFRFESGVLWMVMVDLGRKDLRTLLMMLICSREITVLRFPLVQKKVLINELLKILTKERSS
jgi:hypothetical protein